MRKKVIVVGGGAAGFFFASNCQEKNPETEVIVLEKSKSSLQKVKISGRGRCNVTNATFIPHELVKNYPRGSKELMSVFSQFQPADTFEWFSSHNVELCIQEDNRVFPQSNNSQTIVDCLFHTALNLGVQFYNQQIVKKIEKKEAVWIVKTQNKTFEADKIVIASGSSKTIWKILEELNHTIIKPVPSLFTFNCNDRRIKGLMGLALPCCKIKIKELNTDDIGAVLITHWGFSGPGILKLSAWKARELAELNYCFTLKINWLDKNFNNVLEELKAFKIQYAKMQIKMYNPYEIPKRLWIRFLETSCIKEILNWGDINKKQLNTLASELTQAEYQITGKNTYKEEFVTAGGVDLKEIDLKTMQSKIHKGLFFAGEVINVDAVTGGYNFQNAWSTAWIASEHI
ncbi:MAG: NAD(P)/FAD-dependent oxidoreductase [Flavobacteriales bacterium]